MTQIDPMFTLLKKEKQLQKKSINLIASENFISANTRKALASEAVHRYAEGYPHARYYGNLDVIDEIESLTQQRALEVFKLNPKKWAVNVQPLSGSPANFAVLAALVKPGKKVAALNLAHGGHLSHGYKVSLTGKFWEQIPYTLDEKTHKLNYEEIGKLVSKEKPKVIIAGYSAYPRTINWKKFKDIADSVGAYLVADISHISGLIAAREFPAPFKYADVVTTTTHKTLRGPRGAMIFSKIDDRDLPKKINKAVFPGLQGGPHMNKIAATGIALFEALQPEFKQYAQQVKANAKVMAQTFKKNKVKVITGGTDSHLVLIDVFSTYGIGGHDAQVLLQKNGFQVNKNLIPFDSRKPNNPSGLRFGSAAETTRGKTEKDFEDIANAIHAILTKASEEK